MYRPNLSESTLIINNMIFGWANINNILCVVNLTDVYDNVSFLA